DTKGRGDAMNFIGAETPQKRRGGYYTPPDVAAFLAEWALEGDRRRVLEPACGDGAFLDAIAQRRPAAAVVACEINPAEAAKAKERARSLGLDAARVCADDFLRWFLSRRLGPPAFDAVLGNPPFIRYQYLDAALQDRAGQIFRT